jgi:hypothetical protein
MLADLLRDHLEELPDDCERRLALLASDRARLADLRRLDERIAGRIDALRLAGRVEAADAALARLAESPAHAIASPLGAQDVPGLLAAIAGNDPAVAIAAGIALERLLGVELAGEKSWTSPTADEFDAGFSVPVPLPDPERARAAWAEAEPRLRTARRIAGGQDLDGTFDVEELDLLTLREVRRELLAFSTMLAVPYADAQRF